MKIDRKAVYGKYNGRCAYCGLVISIKEMQVDHAIPKFHHDPVSGCLVVSCRKFSDYGLNDFRNLMPSCRVCNSWKHTWTIDEFRHELEMQIERLRKYSASFRIVERYGLIREATKEIAFFFERPESRDLL
jgi:5-methylcytosine-specific restriction endonuclease McrA